MTTGDWSALEALEGRTLLVTGSTGFLGRALVEAVLRTTERTRLKLHVRLQDGALAEERLRELRTSDVFDGLVAERGEQWLQETFERRVEAVVGDIAKPELGIDAPKTVMADVDLVVHSAALTTFKLPLDAALSTNVLAAREALALAQRMARPALLHVSTCYVAGLRRGFVPETELPQGYCPRAHTGGAPRLDARAELAAAQAAVARLQQESGDPVWRLTFDEAVNARGSSRIQSPAVRRSLTELERKRWLNQRLVDEGARRARTLGWPNTYSYSKSLAEQLLQAESSGVNLSIVRASIIGPAWRRPSPGWFHGYNPLSPLAYLASSGHALLPGDPALVFDVLPVDEAAGGLLTVAAAMLAGRAGLIHQLGTSTTNPVTLGRVLELFELAVLERSVRNKGWDKPRNMAETLKKLAMSAGAVSRAEYERWGAPGLGALARGATRALRADSMLPGRRRERLAGETHRLAELAGRGEAVIDGFEPFLNELDLRFDVNRALALRAALPAADRRALSFEPEAVDWHTYLLEACAPSLLASVAEGS